MLIINGVCPEERYVNTNRVRFLFVRGGGRGKNGSREPGLFCATSDNYHLNIIVAIKPGPYRSLTSDVCQLFALAFSASSS
jgi:hypothetical protein